MTSLQHGVAGEGGLGLVRLGQIQLAGGEDLVIFTQQGGDLRNLAGVVGGGDDPHPFEKLESHRLSRP